MNRRFFKNRVVFVAQKAFVAWMLVMLAFTDAVPFFGTLIQPRAEAAEVTIDGTVTTADVENAVINPATVFISDQVGYRFYVDSTGVCVYSKTTNGGTSWNAAVTIDSQTDCAGPVIWYDRWTPGDTGNFIHIATFDPSADDVWYNRLDTTSDTRLLGTAPVSVSTLQAGLIAAGTHLPTITKGTDGTIYIGMNSTDSYIVECTTSCNVAGNWTEIGNSTSPLDNAVDFMVLVPLPNGEIMAIRRDVSLEDVQSRVWDNSTWTGSWSTIDSNSVDNALFDGGLSAVSNEDGEVFLAHVSLNATYTNGSHDLRTAKYSGGSWSATTDVITNTTGGLGYVSLMRDLNNDDIYVAYNRRTTIGTNTTGNVYWATSTSAMTTWTAEQGPVNAAAVDVHGVSLNYASDERVHVSWHEDNAAGNDFVLGDTLRDISPTVIVSASGTQTTVVRASTTNFYVGGKFVIDENVTSRNVTSIEITENGSVDAATGLNNIKLRYELDTTAPYNCDSESYAGTETQYGTTDSNGFSGANGVSIFTDSVSISPTQAMCVYVVLDVLKAADDQTRIDIEISDPSSDVVVSGGVTPVPSTAIAITGSTTVADDVLTQTHYHWRNDNGTETTATSRTGGVQDTAIAALQQNTPVRLRLGVSNEGSTTTVPMTLRLEYSTTSGVCSEATGWTDVGATNDAWNMFDSTNLTNGNNTTNIATSTGGVTDENTTFLAANGGVRDTSSSLGSLTFATTSFAEAEFSIVASTTAIEGSTYCFRLTDNGALLSVYSQYPQVTIAADVTVSATGTQSASTHVGASNVYLGGAFRFVENSSSRNVTNIVLTEQGSVNGLEGLENIRVVYDLDTSAPYDCASESYAGGETQFGSAGAFSADNGTSSFSGSVAISTTQTMCAYVVYDVTESARNAQTVDITIGSGANDVTVSGGGSVSPSTALDITGTTNINGAVVTQTHYHWRNDDGSETTATSRTGGVDDTPVVDFDLNAPVRLRFGISNEGATSSLPRRYQLEYGIKVTTCDVVSVWTDVGASNDAWNMYDSVNLTDGETTTNIAEASGGVADENTTFVGSNTNVRDTGSLSGTTTLSSTEHTDLEYSITSTATTSYETTYCFRLTQSGTPLVDYTTYAEITTTPKRDFRIQRNTATITGTSTTLVAGVNYTAPSASTSAFIRITNAHHTGAGTSAGGNTQNADDVTAYILNPSNIMTSITIARPNAAINNTRVSWEIVEFIGASSTDNQMIVRAQATTTMTGTNTFATTTINGPISDDSDVVVFITGLRNIDTTTNYPRGQVTSSWSSTTNQAVFQRVANGSTVDISFAVVEFVGQNWKVQRVEHQYTASGTPETENITAVNSLNRTFLHTQKRMGASNNQINFGHEVYLSSIGAVTFQLSPGAATTTGQVSVAWVIENTQTANGAMVVQRGNGNITGGPATEPRITNIDLASPVNALNNSSIFTMTAHGQNTTNYPRVLADATLTSTTTYQLWSSDIGNTQNHWYRTEVVQWPVVDLAIRQNYYRFYVDNDAQTPTDPWPVGASDLGENTTITAADAPLGDGDVIRVRTTLQVNNATLPAGFLSLKLQYALRDSTCSAVETWNDVGNFASSTIWRGYNTSVTDGTALSIDPPTGGDLLISIADRAGRLAEENPSAANPYGVGAGEDVEYDWVLTHNGAQSDATYCFRMVKSDDTPLDSYNNYPQIRTAGFTPVSQNWRWYTDAENETPGTALAAQNTAPIDVDDGETVALRVTIDERKTVPGNNIKFAVQFSEYPDFSVASTAVATSTCTASSTWCYFDGGGVDNATITTRVLTDADTCTSGVGSGCGTHNESSNPSNGFTHTAGSAREYSFTLVNAGARVNRVYYFRIYDVNAAAAVNASTTYPSLVTKGGSLVFESASVGNGVATEGVVTDATSTPTQISFGRLPFGASFEAAYRLSVQTNATEGYQLLMYANQPLTDSAGNEIRSIVGTNANPVAWNTGCTSLPSCFGYHVGDDSLSGTSTRFAPNDTYAAFSTTTPQEVMYSSRTTTSDQSDLIVRIQTTEEQPAGIYENSLIFIAIPSY